jgi:hypothetical protein
VDVTFHHHTNNVVMECYKELRGVVTGSWRKLHNKELHNLKLLPSIVKMTMSRWTRWTVQGAFMGNREMHVRFW